jgi:anti-sigma B factor antagonist
MTINERLVGNALVLDVAGAVVCGKADGLIERAVQQQLDVGRRLVVVNLGDVCSMDAAGLGALAGAYRAARKAACNLRFASLPTRIRHLLAISRLITVFETFDTVEQAADGSADAYHGMTTKGPRRPRSAQLAMVSWQSRGPELTLANQPARRLFHELADVQVVGRIARRLVRHAQRLHAHAFGIRFRRELLGQPLDVALGE